MMKICKQLLAGILISIIIFSNMPMQEVFAEESPISVEEVVPEEPLEQGDMEIPEGNVGQEEAEAPEDIIDSEEMEEPEEPNVSEVVNTPGETVEPEEITESEEIKDPEIVAPVVQDGGEKKENTLLNYVVVEKPYITAPDIQTVVAEIGNETTLLENAFLQYQQIETGETFEVSAEKLEGNTVVFSILHQNQENAAYQLIVLRYMINGKEYSVNFAEIGMNIKYGVNKEVETEPDGRVVTEEDSAAEEANVVVTDAEGGVLSEQDILDAIENSESDLGTSSAVFRRVPSKAGKSNLVVVIDPGHDASHAGCDYFGINEQVLTLKIAKYCKTELETYGNVEVYLTRETEACAWGGSSSCLTNRARFAAEKNANIFISIHLNADDGSGRAYGAEVYYPNPNYRPDLSQTGAELAQVILDRLVELGIHERGILYHYVDDDDPKYNLPDGSRGDKYAVIRECKKYGIPALIVEHAFLSNASDFNNFLNSEEKLNKLGIADATAVAQYYGLQKKESDYPYASGDAKLEVAFRNNGTECGISAAGIPKAHKVSFAVWSPESGGADMKWHNAVKDAAGNWNVSFPLTNLKQGVTYAVHCYIERTNGTSYYVGGTGFAVSKPTATGISVENIDNQVGKFDIRVKGATSAAGIRTVEVAVWSASDQNDLKWYTAQREANGDFFVKADIANHKYNYGNYYIHAYATDGNGIYGYIAATTANLAMPSLGTPKFSATANASNTKYTIKGSNIAYTGSNILKTVKYGVWSTAGGQDDLRWYTASLNGSGQWEAEVNIQNHKTAGAYQVHAYVELKNGTSMYAGATGFNVPGPKATGITVENVNNLLGRFDIKVKGASSSAGISLVEVAVWSAANQNDLKWYTAQRDASGAYIVEADIANHKYNYGNYYIHAYATDGNGVSGCVATTTVSITKPLAKIEATANAANTRYTIKGSNIAYTGSSGIREVKYGVWSTAGGQDDLRWYTASLNGSGQWVAEVNIQNHKTAGAYQVHAYVELKNGTSMYAGATGFSVPGPKATGIIVENINNLQGRFDIKVKGASSSAGISLVEVAVWSAANQNDLKWYTAQRDASGAYVVEADIANHKYNYGNYYIHAYATDGNGVSGCVATAAVNITKPLAKIEATANTANTRYTIKGNNIAYTGSSAVKNVKYGVWSTAGGQDDLKWYIASLNGSGQWVAEVNIQNHKTAGAYQVHAYVELKNGTSMYAGATGFNVPRPTATSVEIVNKNENAGTFQVRVNGVNSSAGISKVEVAVWCDKNQNDLVWYNATRIDEHTYIVYVDVVNHRKNLGNYQAHVYVTDNNGISVMAGGTSCQMLNVSNAYYNIVGSSAVTAQQLAAYYSDNERYPVFYANTDAPTLDIFCRMYIEECNAEGIKAEVAFCQAMKETGFLRFLGDVKKEQFNFAGLDTTGERFPDGTVDVGRSYSSVREGIRAHIQRLKAYAVKGTTPESFAYPCIDSDKYASSWWRNTIVGSAPYVEWLGKSQNPSGFGWATDPNYGYSIINNYIAKLINY